MIYEHALAKFIAMYLRTLNHRASYYKSRDKIKKSYSANHITKDQYLKKIQELETEEEKWKKAYATLTNISDYHLCSYCSNFDFCKKYWECDEKKDRKSRVQRCLRRRLHLFCFLDKPYLFTLTELDRSIESKLLPMPHIPFNISQRSNIVSIHA